MRSRRSNTGISIAEIAVTIAVLGVLALLMPAGFRLLNGLYRQGMTVQLERDAQIALYQLTTEIRNAQSISLVEADTLEFRSYDFANHGFDSANASLFDTANLGTVRYEYMTDGGETWLNKRVDVNGTTRETRLFKNILTPPSPVQYIFNNPSAHAGTTDTVRMVLRLNIKDAPRTYEDEVMMRTFNN